MPLNPQRFGGYFFMGGNQMNQLIICEKPSVARSIADVLGANKKQDGYIDGNGFLVAWCFGHLLELAAPDAYGEQFKKWRYEDLPIIPRADRLSQEWKHNPSKDKAAQLKILKDLMNRSDVECVVNAADAGREGELIFRLTYEYAKCRKPIKRLWISSMEDAAIRNGFANLKDGADYDSLCAAAKCREQADWLVGINATRLFSVLYGVTLNTGRVQSPTLAMLVKRENEIANFVKTPFYTAEIRANSFTAASERFDDKAKAENAVSGINSATVTAVKQTEKSVTPPKLYDLTTLQREANRAHGFTAQQTLDYVQSLYEKKIATYPRTDSRYLTDDMAVSVTELVHAINANAPCEVSQVINSKKVSDHHAIIPTADSVNADTSALPSGEAAILEMLTNRLICAVGEKHRYLETVITLDCNSTEFKTKGKVVIYNGWKDYASAAVADDEDDSDAPSAVPQIEEGATFPVTASVKEGFTSPPKHFTEDTILSAMTGARLAEMAGAEDMLTGGRRPDDAERKGLGTPATRAAILEKLVKSGFAERSKKNLLPTDKGKNLIAVLPNSLTSAKLTAEWEDKLLQVQRGEISADEFMVNITSFTKSIVLSNNAPNPEFVSLFPESKKADVPALGICPRCGSPVREGQKGYFCDSRTCGFKLWKESKFWTAKKKPLTAAIVERLLKDGKVALKDLYSEKTGKTYSATVILDDTGDKFVNFKMEFSNTGRAKK
jgi:DNA topoisomerase-3